MNSVGGEADPLQCRVRTLLLEPTRPAQPGSEKRDSAATMESIAGSTGRMCASGTLGANFGMVDCANLTLKFSGCEAIHCNAGLGRAFVENAKKTVHF